MPPPEPIDLLVAGDWVVTMDPARSMIRDGAVAVHDGRIVDVGPATAMRRPLDAAASASAVRVRS